jgi:hypothetical protein
LLLLTSTVCSDVSVVNPFGIVPVRLFPDKMSVPSDVRFVIEGEMLPDSPFLLKTIDVTAPVVSQEIPDHGVAHGSAPTHVSAIACGQFAAARKSNNAFTVAEHATPAPAQYVDACPVGVM